MRKTRWQERFIFISFSSCFPFHYEDVDVGMSFNEAHDRRSRDKHLTGGGSRGHKRGSLPPSASTVHSEDGEVGMSSHD